MRNILLTLTSIFCCCTAYALPDGRDTVSVTVIGDVMLHKSQIDNCFERYRHAHGEADPDDGSCYDFSPYFKNIAHFLEDADISVANMEFTLAGAPFSGYPAFGAPDSYADYVADCGVDVFLTANNHILDRDRAGIKRTLAVYEKMKNRGVLNTGSFADTTSFLNGYPLIMECKGLKIAFVNFTYGTNVDIDAAWPKVCRTSFPEIRTAMKKARENADVVIALPHWGIEYDLQHSAEQRKVAEFLAKNGADVIVGGHPHVVQDLDTLTVGDKSVPVIYSLGNIISNMSATNTQIGLIVTLRFVKGPEGVEMLPVEYRLTWCSLPGRLTDSHITIPVKEFIGTRSKWLNPADYDKMTSTWKRILQTSGIVEQ